MISLGSVPAAPPARPWLSLDQELPEEKPSSDPGRMGVNGLVNDSANPEPHVIVMGMLHRSENKILI